MKQFTCSLFSLFFCFAPITLEAASSVKVVVSKNEHSTPSGFRLAQEKFKRETSVPPSRSGLKELRASGSGQYSEKSLEVALSKIPAKRQEIILIDLRQESHGFVDGAPIRWEGTHNWANRDKSPAEIYAKERKLLSAIAEEGKAHVYKSGEHVWIDHIKRVETEELLAQRLNVSYERFYVTDHSRPSDEEVNHFVAFVKQLAPKAWLHFHCYAGIGRTTTFLAMYDMMRNAGAISRQDIVKRQYLLGGQDLSNTNKSSYKKDLAIERYAFIKHFYNYCKANPTFDVKWTSWLKKNPM